MSLCDDCIAKSRDAAGGSSAVSEGEQVSDSRSESREMLNTAGAVFVPIVAQVFWVTVLPDRTFTLGMLGLLVSLAVGAAFVWRIFRTPRARSVAVVMYVLVYGPLLLIGTLNWYISKHGL